VNVKLYGIPGSHPVMTARLMLEHKGIDYRRLDLLPVLSRGIVRLLGFPGNRVPAMKIDGRRVQGSRQIARELDRIQPEPPLFPSDPGKRQAVEEAEAWGDEFQQIPRTVIWWAIKREPDSQLGFLEDARLGIPLPPRLLVRTSAPVIWAGRRLNDSYDPTVKRMLTDLPSALDRIDRWIADGVLDGEELNAADFQIATSLRLLMCMEDLEPAIEVRPAGKLAKRVVPAAPGRIKAVFPPAWLEPLRAPGGVKAASER
jgi:glutathione S-transferase